MAKISTYPILSDPTINDILIGTDVQDLNITKNFSIGSIIDIVGEGFVPYVGAIDDVNLGSFDITSSAFIVGGGLASQFLKADGSLDPTIYQPAGNYITQLSGEATALGPGNATITLSNSAVINKVLTGLNITGSAIVATDSILTAFGKVQNQINTLVGGVQYKGTWNAATNTPTLQSSVGVQGNYYVVSVAGSTNLNGITDWKLGDWAIFNGSAWEKVDNTDAVISVNGQIGAVVLTTTDIAEGTNLYYTDLRSRSAISLTTIGNSGSATYNYTTGIFNIPNYTLGGLGGVPTSRTLTINGTAFDLSADRSWSVGTVTSIATTGPLTGGTITGSGTIGITQAGVSSDGYLSSADWNTFNNKQNAITNPVTGTGTPNTLPMWGSTTSLVNSPLSYAADAFNFQYNSATGGTVNFTNIGLTAYTYSIQMNNFGSPRSTVHSYTDGLVIQFIGGTQVSRMFANGNLILGTGVVDNGHKLEVSGTLALRASASASAATQVPVFIADPSGTTRELVTRTPAQLLGDAGGVTGTGASGQVAFWNGTSSQTGDNGLFWDNTNKRLGIGDSAPSDTLVVNGRARMNGTNRLAFGNSQGGFAQIGVSAASVGNLQFLTYNGTTLLERLRITLDGNILINTTTDSGFRLDVNGTARVQGALTTTADAVVNGVNIGRGGASISTNTRVGTGAGSANTTGSSNSFFGFNSGAANTTGVNNSFFGQSSGLSTTTGSGNSYFGLSSGNANTSGNTNSYFGLDSGLNNTTGSENVFIGSRAGRFLADGATSLTIANNSVFLGRDTRAAADNQTNQIAIGHTAIGLGSNTTVIGNSSTTFGRWFGNLLIGSSTNSGQVLQVTGTSLLNGLSTIQGTTASDSGQLGTELLTTGTGDASWTGTSFATGYTHVAGSTTTLTSTLAGVVNTFYQIAYTVTGRTTGSFVIDFGGFTSAALTSSNTIGPRATTTGTLVITPTSDFNGTIVLSIRVISISSASVTFNNSAGNLSNQIRISSLDSNSFFGFNSGRTNTTGTNNSFYGRDAGINNTTASNNSFFGRGAGFANTTASNNSFFGSLSGTANITGGSNAFFGSLSGTANTTGANNSFFGTSAGTTNTTGGSNNFFGQASGGSNTTGSSNAFFGNASGFANTTASNNSFFGVSSGQANTTGASNSFFGNQSGQSNTTGGSNTAFGSNSLQTNTTGISNTAVGLQSLFNNTSSNNTAVGLNSLFSNTSGNSNTGIGFETLHSNGTGANNTALGREAGRYTGTGTTAMTSVNNSIYLGYRTRGLNATGSTNELVIGYDVVGLGSNTTVLGNTSTTHGRWYGSLLLGTTTNAASSILTMESTTQGVLFPRMTTTQKNAISTPATGLVVYDTTLNKLAVYTGAAWETVTSL
jgi:hypothetical protein